MKKVAILMGSKSDLEIMNKAKAALDDFSIESSISVISAHRAPHNLVEFVRKSEEEGVEVFIAGAGLAAHLPGVVAAHTVKPVIGVPIGSGPLAGQDALLAIVQMPKGVPVATVAINGAENAGLLATQILAVDNADLKKKLRQRRDDDGKRTMVLDATTV